MLDETLERAMNGQRQQFLKREAEQRAIEEERQAELGPLVEAAEAVQPEVEALNGRLNNVIGYMGYVNRLTDLGCRKHRPIVLKRTNSSEDNQAPLVQTVEAHVRVRDFARQQLHEGYNEGDAKSFAATVVAKTSRKADELFLEEVVKEHTSGHLQKNYGVFMHTPYLRGDVASLPVRVGGEEEQADYLGVYLPARTKEIEDLEEFAKLIEVSLANKELNPWVEQAKARLEQAEAQKAWKQMTVRQQLGHVAGRLFRKS